jgi:hypothetical protein
VGVEPAEAPLGAGRRWVELRFLVELAGEHSVALEEPRVRCKPLLEGEVELLRALGELIAPPLRQRAREDERLPRGSDSAQRVAASTSLRCASVTLLTV